MYKYELYGVCNHSGGVMGGHYTAYVKNANNKWYHFNDTSVSEVGVQESIISPKAYVLFYRNQVLFSFNLHAESSAVIQFNLFVSLY
jgi:ubiquitin C-terminal hydrolase